METLQIVSLYTYNSRVHCTYFLVEYMFQDLCHVHHDLTFKTFTHVLSAESPQHHVHR